LYPITTNACSPHRRHLGVAVGVERRSATLVGGENGGSKRITHGVDGVRVSYAGISAVSLFIGRRDQRRCRR
jgi:hypothetical protein